MTPSSFPSTVPMSSESGTDAALHLQDRHILTKVGVQPITFPVQWVAEILIIERSAVLPLPFYGPLVLGVVHHQGKMIPLIQTPQGGMIQQTTPSSPRLMRESLSVVRLNSLVQSLTNVGLVVDQVIGSFSQEQIAHEAATRFELPVRAFQADDIPSTVWQPRDWQRTMQRD